MILWQFFPKSKIIPVHLHDVVVAFEKCKEEISSEYHNYGRNDVLEKICTNLESLSFAVEKSKKSTDKIKLPVLFGPNGKLEKYFDADGYNAETKTVIEVEA